MFGLVGLIICCGYIAVLTYTVLYQVDTGIAYTDAKLPFMLIGIMSAPARIIMGYMGDKGFSWLPCVTHKQNRKGRKTRLIIFTVSIFIAGLAITIIPIHTTYAMFATMSSMFGFFTGTLVSLIPAIIIDFVGLRNLAKAFGIIQTLQCVAYFVGPTLCGAIAQATGSFTASFIIAGVALMVAAVLILIILKDKFVSKVEEPKELDETGKVQAKESWAKIRASFALPSEKRLIELEE